MATRAADTVSSRTSPAPLMVPVIESLMVLPMFPSTMYGLLSTTTRRHQSESLNAFWAVDYLLPNEIKETTALNSNAET